MVAVDNEINLPDLVQDDGGQADVGVKSQVYPLPAFGCFPLGGQEGAVKLVVAIKAANNLFDRHGLYAPIDWAANTQFFFDFIIRK